ncbi:unnamed protein product [Diatraea saccharalis]|uniref:Uncharacterized protein n=1 Tax=Diatraea saccharalis TaxID=40085 RepID=A0A9N9QTQ6_9NEOP|nr:unnamed protein product [Diatraea saccharalis]
MTSPRRTKKTGAQCIIQNVDWDSPSADTGTVKRRRSCPENSKQSLPTQEAIFEVQTPSDSGSGTSRSIDDTDKSDSLIDIEQRISCIINESRSSKSNSESSDVDIFIENLLENPIDDELFGSDKNDTKTLTSIGTDATFVNDAANDKKCKGKRLKPPTPVKKNNKSDVAKNKTTIESEKIGDKATVLPVYRCSLQGSSIDFNASNQKKKGTSKLKLPFSPNKTMDKPKINFFQNKNNVQQTKSPLLSSPVRRTISNEYVRLKFTNDTVMRRTIDGKSIPKITPKIQSIIPESPIDNEDPFLNLSPNKKYTVTVNNKVRCDKDNYVIFDPNTGFNPEAKAKQSLIPLKSPKGEKSRIPLKSPVGESSGVARKSANVSDTDSGILSPNSPETSEKGAYYVNAAAFSATAKRYADLDITILDPVLAKKATEQIKVS